MAQMHINIAAIYHKYITRLSPKMTDAMMEVDDVITSAPPMVLPIKVCLTN
jgi:hypothetical protein